MRIMYAILKRRKTPSEEDKGMLAMYDHPRTELDRGSIAPLVNYVRSLEV